MAAMVISTLLNKLLINAIALKKKNAHHKWMNSLNNSMNCESTETMQQEIISAASTNQAEEKAPFWRRFDSVSNTTIINSANAKMVNFETTSGTTDVIPLRKAISSALPTTTNPRKKELLVGLHTSQIIWFNSEPLSHESYILEHGGTWNEWKKQQTLSECHTPEFETNNTCQKMNQSADMIAGAHKGSTSHTPEKLTTITY